LITIVSQLEFVFFIVKKYSATYQSITKATAFLLLMAFLIPTGLHAKQLMDFCMMEMGTHQMATSSSSHDCCDSEPADEKDDKHQHHDCDWGFICACSIGQSQLADEDWIPTTKNLEFTLSQQGDLAPFFTFGEHIQADQQIRIGEYDPPLWLLYDTFLM